MPSLDPNAVDALAEAVGPLVETDDALKAWCTRANVERFLRADRGNLDKATKRLLDTLRWRKENRPETKMCTACFSVDVRSHYMQHVGWDKHGRALVYSDIGMARDKAPATNVEHCVQVLELLEPQLKPFPNDQYVWVVDFHKFGLADMSPKVAGACLSLFGKSYPERLAGMILVGAPMLFNGLYRAVSAFADPVTVKKVRFCRGPDGRGGGKSWDSVIDEFFDLETKTWLATEMTENRASWRDVAKHKSWLASVLVGDGNAHGWQTAHETETSARKKKTSSYDQKKIGGVRTNAHLNERDPVSSVSGHDIRGCGSFLSDDARVAARTMALKHASRGVATRGVILEAARKKGLHEIPEANHAAAADDDGDVFYDAEEHLSCVVVECAACVV